MLIYNTLVNRQTGIAERYHRVHDRSHGIGKVLSWGYLLWLNLCYYVFFCRFLGEKSRTTIYETVPLRIDKSEGVLFAELHPELTVDNIIQKLSSYDIISFDVFDTLIYRPFDCPTDVFFLIGEKIGILDFKNKRILAEYRARMIRNKAYGDMEVNLYEIWEILEADIGIPAEEGARLEIETELSLCYPNPLFTEVWSRLTELGKKRIITTDMYLPRETIAALLDKNSFTGYEKLYLSNNYLKSKAKGDFYDVILKDHSGSRIIHVGDNAVSDVENAKQHGLDTFQYQNVNASGQQFRARDMSAIIGSGYRGVVNAWLYNSAQNRSLLYEYGFIYGGLFVVGYCSFIHQYRAKHDVDKILFLSRDGDILKQAYDILYPEDSVAYAYWSRKAATKLTAAFDREDFFRRFLFHKVNQEITIEKILLSMELKSIISKLMHARTISAGKERFGNNYPADAQRVKVDDICLNDNLTDKNVWLLRCMLEVCWEDVLKCYEDQQKAAKAYYTSLMGDAKRVMAVDIGWAGSGALALSLLARKEWHLQTEVIGMIAGTNTPFNAEPDASESFLQSGQLVSYLYSQRENRDLLKKHDPNADYNIYWELLLSSPTRQFSGFYPGNCISDPSDVYLPESDVTLRFGRYDDNLDGIREIQTGILDFVSEYQRHFADYPYMFQISGRDAYAPILAAASHHERYLKAIAKAFQFEVNVV